MVLLLKFTAFHTESGYDFLTIRDGDGTTLMPRMSGSGLPEPAIFSSRTNVVNLFFETDGGTAYSGWSVKWTAVTGNFNRSLVIFVKTHPLLHD